MGPLNALAQNGGDPADQTANYNTPLSPREEAAFQAWAQQTGKARDLYDYDLRGAWKSNTKAASSGHLPDTWKKPNHPTFSQESIYSGPYTPGGQWAEQPGNKWSFTATPQNLKYQDANALANYFQRVEPGNALVLPQNPLGGR